MSEKREPGYYWVILDEVSEPEIAHWDGDDWFPVGSGVAIEPKAVLSERIEPPASPDAKTGKAAP